MILEEDLVGIAVDFSPVADMFAKLQEEHDIKTINQTAVLFPNFNRVEYTKITLWHYLHNTPTPHYLYLADNGSTDGTKEFLKSLEGGGFQSQYPHIKFVFKYYDKNYMYATMINDFFKWAEAMPEIKYLGRILNDDLCPENWLSEFIRLFEKADKKGINIGAIFTSDGQAMTDGVKKNQPERIIDLGDGDILVDNGMDGHGQLMKKGVIKTLRDNPRIANDGYIEERGVMAPAFYYGYMMQAGFKVVNHPWMATVLLDTHPVLNLEDTNKYKRYKEMIHSHKMGWLQVPPSDMYEGLKVVGE